MNLVRQPVAGHPPHTTDSLSHHLRYTCRLGKIILSNQQVTTVVNQSGSELRIIERALELFFNAYICTYMVIEVILLQGHAFLLAVDILANWLREYRRDQGRTKSQVESSAR